MMSRPTITIVDYGGSNLRSVAKAFEYVGANIRTTDDPAVVRRAGRLVLPGVGAFGAGIAALRQRGLDEAVREAAQKGAPLLGICLGMQLLFDGSEEADDEAGLGLIAGWARRFRFDAGKTRLKTPHMGWNQIMPARPSPLLAGTPAGSYAYFVHSYYCVPAGAESVLAWTDYGRPFAAIVAQENIFGIQFHPEKSQTVGLRILQNYAAL